MIERLFSNLAPLIRSDSSEEVLQFLRTGEINSPINFRDPIPTFLRPNVIAIDEYVFALATYEFTKYPGFSIFNSLYLSFDHLKDGESPRREPILIDRHPSPVTLGGLGFSIPTGFLPAHRAISYIYTNTETLLNHPCNHQT